MSETSTTMLSNSAFILLLNQSSKDIEKIVESLEISEEQLNYVIDSPSGCGLIKCGSRMVPFDNVIDKGQRACTDCITLICMRRWKIAKRMSKSIRE